MVMCPCGSLTTPAQSRRNGSVLRWQHCGSCGRCGNFELRIGVNRVAKNEVARRVFRDTAALEWIHGRVNGQGQQGSD